MRWGWAVVVPAIAMVDAGVVACNSHRTYKIQKTRDPGISFSIFEHGSFHPDSLIITSSRAAIFSSMLRRAVQCKLVFSFFVYSYYCACSQRFFVSNMSFFLPLSLSLSLSLSHAL
jgi:hypothetical protein